MTVAEAINILQKLPLDMEIVVQDGMDPSDWTFAKEIHIDKLEVIGCRPVKIVCVVVS